MWQCEGQTITPSTSESVRLSMLNILFAFIVSYSLDTPLTVSHYVSWQWFPVSFLITVGVHVDLITTDAL